MLYFKDHKCQYTEKKKFARKAQTVETVIGSLLGGVPLPKDFPIDLTQRKDFDTTRTPQQIVRYISDNKDILYRLRPSNSRKDAIVITYQDNQKNDIHICYITYNPSNLVYQAWSLERSDKAISQAKNLDALIGTLISTKLGSI